MSDQTSSYKKVSQLDDWAGIADQIQTILTEMAVSITVQDKRGRLVYANSAAIDRMHYKVTDKGRPTADPTKSFDIYTQSDVKLKLDELPSRRVLRGEEWAEAVLHFIGRNHDDEFWLMVKAVPVKDDLGVTNFVVTISNDITALKQTEIRLRNNNDRLMKTLESVMDSQNFDEDSRRRRTLK